MRVMITAPTGKMGKRIIAAAAAYEEIEISAVLGRPGASYLGKDAGVVSGLGQILRVAVSDDLHAAIVNCDVIIDFSTTEVSMEVLSAARKAGKAIILGTTGFSEAEVAEIREASADIPVMKAANTSYVVNVLKELAALATKALEGKADIDFIEMHDRLKKDAPSGTAKEIAEAMTTALGQEKNADLVTFHSIRSGDISSSHTVIFGCLGERLELTHHAQDWECFAHGAIDAALYISDKPAGWYGMQDVVRSIGTRPTKECEHEK